jgi:hypothetical protein
MHELRAGDKDYTGEIFKNTFYIESLGDLLDKIPFVEDSPETARARN